MTNRQTVESAVRAVYDFCPPTLTKYSAQGRDEYRAQWGTFLAALGLPPASMRDKRLLDIGCGSAEKATFYHDWGARVTGVEMTPAVLECAYEVIGDRDIRIVRSSLFELTLDEQFDIVVSDGVLHHTADTRAALASCVRHVAPGGMMMFSLINVWGSFWWFKPARGIARLLGGQDYHARARWGQRLFARFRTSQEGIERDSPFFRSADSWAYDWFANPRWNAHRPAEIARWLDDLGLDHVGSTPPLFTKRPAAARGTKALRLVTGGGPAAMSLYWFASGEPNMVYVVARKRR